MPKQRDHSIDFFKGVAVLAIILIHTTWWSGVQYVPKTFANLTLLIDIPLFFFLSGASANFSFKKDNPFSGIVRLAGLFALFYLILYLFVDPQYAIAHFVRSLFLNYGNSKPLEVVLGSNWFIPVFVVVYILGLVIVKNLGKKHVLAFLSILLFTLLTFYDSITFFKHFTILKIKPDLVIAYLFFFLFGYYYFAVLKQWKHIKWFGLGIALVSLIATIYNFYDVPFNIQDDKFPPRIKYVIASLISVGLMMFLAQFVKKEYKINYIGKNALSFFLGQSISASILMFIEPELRMYWLVKFLILFALNLIMSTAMAIIIKYIYKYYSLAIHKSFNFIDNLGSKKN